MSSNEWIDIDVLEDYLDGKLDAKMMHQVEKISLEDPFVAEALAGLSLSPKRTQTLSLLQKQLHDRIAQKPKEKKLWAITSQRLSIAATAAVLFITVSVLFYMRESNRREALANKQDKKVEIAIAPEVVTVKVDTLITAAPKSEIDKVITNSKSNGYASINKPRKKSIVVYNSPQQVVQAPIRALTPEELSKAVAAPNVAAVKTAEVEEEVLSAKAKEYKPVQQELLSKTAGITPATKLLRGQVVDKYTGMPIPGADVMLSSSNVKTTTNNNGEFYFSLDSVKNQNLAINSVGFNTKQVKTNSSQSIKVELESSSSALNEVVIAANEKKTSATVTPSLNGAQPVVGWKDYERFVKANTKLAQANNGHYEVTLVFDVTKDGTVDHILISLVKEQVITSEMKKYQNEAVRLLKTGPKWIYTPGSANRGELKITF